MQDQEARLALDITPCYDEMIILLLTTLLGNLNAAHIDGFTHLPRPASRRELYSSAFVCILPLRNLTLCLASMNRGGLYTVAATARPPRFRKRWHDEGGVGA